MTRHTNHILACAAVAEAVACPRSASTLEIASDSSIVVPDRAAKGVQPHLARAAGELFTQGLPRVFGTRCQELFVAIAMAIILTVTLHLWRKLRQGGKQ